MKKIFRKNQIIITALAVLIAIAGYLKYADEGMDAGTMTANNEKSSEEEPGDAIMVSNNTTSDVMINAKIQREQVRAQNKEELMEIINNVDLTEAQKQDAVNKVAELTDISEKELAAETLIMSKGLQDVIVNMVDGNVEVIVAAQSLDNSTKIQIEDVVKRKFEVTADKITISLVGEKK